MTDLPPGFEKRRFTRFPLAFDPRYQGGEGPALQVRSGERTESGRLVDISIGGIGFVSPVAFAKNAPAEVDFDLILKDGRCFRVQAQGVVRFCGASAPPKRYRIGLEFTGITQAQQGIIGSYIESLL